jgi:hypothetical protein
MNIIHQTVRDYIKKNISLQEDPIDHTPFIESLYQYPIDETIASQLVWVVLGTIDLFHDDFDTVVLKCSDDLTFKLLQFCIEKGADMNDSIQEENDMDWHAKYPDYNSILDILYHIARIHKTKNISILVIVMARCMACSSNPSTITDSDILQLVLSKITRHITVDEVYISYHINAIERLYTQKPSMPLLDILFQRTLDIPIDMLYDAIDYRDNVLCQYYLKYVKDMCVSLIDARQAYVKGIADARQADQYYRLWNDFKPYDINHIPTIILQSSNSISLRIVESLPKSIVATYYSDVDNTLLHFACNRGHEQMVKVLLSKGVDVNKRNQFGESAIFWACKNGNPYIVTHILRKGVDQSYDTLLGYAKRFNRPTVRKVLLEFKYAKKWYSKTKVTVMTLIDQFNGIDVGVIQKIVAFT